MRKINCVVTWRIKRAFILSVCITAMIGVIFLGVWLTSPYAPSAIEAFGPLVFVWIAGFAFGVLLDNTDKL